MTAEKEHIRTKKKYGLPDDLRLSQPSVDVLDAGIDIDSLEEELSSVSRSDVKVIQVVTGYSVTRYEFELESDNAANRIILSLDKIGEALGVGNLRFSYTDGVGEIEAENRKIADVGLRDILNTQHSGAHTVVGIGKYVDCTTASVDLERVGNILAVGNDGNGKSGFINSIVIGLVGVYSPDELEIVAAESEKRDLSAYGDIPHMYCGGIVDGETFGSVIAELAEQAEKRRELLDESGCGGYSEFNMLPDVVIGRKEKMKRIAVVIDDYAAVVQSDCALRHRIEDGIARIFECGDGVGIHVIVVTKSASPDIITSKIRDVFGMRIAFSTETAAQSRAAIDVGGAERLCDGDMLVAFDGILSRVRCASVSRSDVSSVAKWIKDAVNNGELGNAERGANRKPDTPVGQTAPRGGESGTVNRAVPDYVYDYITRTGAKISDTAAHFGIDIETAARCYDELNDRGAIEYRKIQ